MARVICMFRTRYTHLPAPSGRTRRIGLAASARLLKFSRSHVYQPARVILRDLYNGHTMEPDPMFPFQSKDCSESTSKEKST